LQSVQLENFYTQWTLNNHCKYISPNEEANKLLADLFENTDSSKNLSGNLTPVANPSAFALNKPLQNQK